jgi:hypothetical protein
MKVTEHEICFADLGRLVRSDDHLGDGGEKAGNSNKVERPLAEYVGKKIKAAQDMLFSFAVQASEKMQMKDAMKVAEQWAIELLGGKRTPGVSNWLDAFNKDLLDNQGLRKDLEKVDWCK